MCRLTEKEKLFDTRLGHAQSVRLCLLDCFENSVVCVVRRCIP